MDYSSIGAALQSFGGFVSDRYAQKEAEKKQKEREEAAKRALEEAEKKRIERRQLYKKNTDVSWNSNLPSYLKNENTVSAVPMWRELGTNSRGEVVQDIPANEAQLYQIQQEEELLRNQAQEQARLRGREEEEFGMKKEKHKSGLARDAASIESSRASAASSRAYAENLKSGGLSGRPTVDPFKEESDLAYLVGTKEGGAGIDAEYQAELAKAVNGAQAMGVDEAKLALTRREIARIFINKLKRLPNKAKEE